MNIQDLAQITITAMIFGALVAVIMVLVLVYFLILGARIARFHRLLEQLPRLAGALRTLADCLEGAARGAETAGGAATNAGQALQNAGQRIDHIEVPTGSLRTDSLWSYIGRPPNAPNLYVLTSVTIGMRNLFASGESPVTGAGNQMAAAGGSLGPSPSQPGTVSYDLHASAKSLREFAQFVDSLP